MNSAAEFYSASDAEARERSHYADQALAVAESFFTEELAEYCMRLSYGYTPAHEQHIMEIGICNDAYDLAWAQVCAGEYDNFDEPIQMTEALGLVDSRLELLAKVSGFIEAGQIARSVAMIDHMALPEGDIANNQDVIRAWAAVAIALRHQNEGPGTASIVVGHLLDHIPGVSLMPMAIAVDEYAERKGIAAEEVLVTALAGYERLHPELLALIEQHQEQEDQILAFELQNSIHRTKRHPMWGLGDILFDNDQPSQLPEASGAPRQSSAPGNQLVGSSRSQVTHVGGNLYQIRPSANTEGNYAEVILQNPKAFANMRETIDQSIESCIENNQIDLALKLLSHPHVQALIQNRIVFWAANIYTRLHESAS